MSIESLEKQDDYGCYLISYGRALLSDPKISVVVSVYNEEKYLTECIESLLKQSYGKFELIIVDDGSCDQSYSIIKTFVSKDHRIV